MSDIAPVTVVVPTIGREALLADCLRSLGSAEPRAAEVLVVDQSGEGAADAAARAAGVSVRVLPRQRDGLAAALNAGLAAAAHDAVLVTHDDCRVAPDWVGVGADLLERHPDELHTGRVLPDGDGEAVPSTMTSPTPAVYEGVARADVLYPNCMALSASAVLALGGFDRRFVRAAEDNDFCFRWLGAGKRIRYTPALTVWHRDWRTPAALRDLYRMYWEAQGELLGVHLRRRDRRILTVLRDNVAWAARGTMRRRARPWRAGPPDPTYAAFTRLPLGLVRGLVRSPAQASRDAGR